MNINILELLFIETIKKIAEETWKNRKKKQNSGNVKKFSEKRNIGIKLKLPLLNVKCYLW